MTRPHAELLDHLEEEIAKRHRKIEDIHGELDTLEEAHRALTGSPPMTSRTLKPEPKRKPKRKPKRTPRRKPRPRATTGACTGQAVLDLLLSAQEPMSAPEIAKIFGVHPGRVHAALTRLKRTKDVRRIEQPPKGDEPLKILFEAVPAHEPSSSEPEILAPVK